MNNAYVIELSHSYAGDSSYYLVWCADADGVNRLRTRNGKLLCYGTEQDAIAAAGIHDCETVFFDAERLDYWLFTGSRSQIYVDDILDAGFLLNFWNLFTDIADSLGMDLTEPDEAEDCYRKLFRATQASEQIYKSAAESAVLTDAETEMIRRVLQSGMDMLMQNLTYADGG